MNEATINQIRRFINNEPMSAVIKECLLASFLKAKPNQDVYQLAASRLAINLLEEAWQVMDRFKESQEKEGKVSVQVGL